MASTRVSSPRSTASWASLARPPMPGIRSSSWPIGPIFLICCIWSRKSSSVKAVALELVGELRRLALVEVLLGPLDEGHHVAHAQDAAGQPVGVERLERVGLLARAQELDRQAGHGARSREPRRHEHRRRSWSASGRSAGRRRGTPRRRSRPPGRPSRRRRAASRTGATVWARARISAMSVCVDRSGARPCRDDDVAPGLARPARCLPGDVRHGRPVRRAVDGDVELRPRAWSWSTAAGRYGSAATSSGRRPCLTM